LERVQFEILIFHIMNIYYGMGRLKPKDKRFKTEAL
jgi:hypothetical protein